MERKLGEVFEFNGKEYKVVEGIKTGFCDGCAFVDKPVHDCMYIAMCLTRIREDGKSIIFVEVEE